MFEAKVAIIAEKDTMASIESFQAAVSRESDDVWRNRAHLPSPGPFAGVILYGDMLDVNLGYRRKVNRFSRRRRKRIQRYRRHVRQSDNRANRREGISGLPGDDDLVRAVRR